MAIHSVLLDFIIMLLFFDKKLCSITKWVYTQDGYKAGRPPIHHTSYKRACPLFEFRMLIFVYQITFFFLLSFCYYSEILAANFLKLSFDMRKIMTKPLLEVWREKCTGYRPHKFHGFIGFKQFIPFELLTLQVYHILVVSDCLHSLDSFLSTWLPISFMMQCIHGLH